MIDAIIYVADFITLVGYLDTNAPESLARDEDGAMVQPPVVTGFARTPAVVGPDGNSILAYVRMTDEQVSVWRDTPGVEILAESPYQGKGTGDIVYQKLFADAEAMVKYEAVYDGSAKTYTDENGDEYISPARPKFGVMA